MSRQSYCLCSDQLTTPGQMSKFHFTFGSFQVEQVLKPEEDQTNGSYMGAKHITTQEE